MACPAMAGPSRVVLVRPAEAALAEAVTRTRAELALEGFEVMVVPATPDADPRAVVERIVEEQQALAAISFSLESTGAKADLWVTDRATQKTSVRTVDVSQVAAPERPRALAIRAVELLRASLVEAVADETASHPTTPLPAPVKSWLDDRAPLQGVGFQLGVGLLTSFDGVGPAGGPVARISWGHAMGLGARLSIAGPHFGARPTGPLGAAAVRQELATADLFYAPNLDAGGFVALGWLGAGAYHLRADGQLDPPRTSQSADVWAAAFVGGAGIGYRLTPHLTVLLDGAVLLLAPQVRVTAEGEPMGTAGRPSLLSSLGIAASF